MPLSFPVLALDAKTTMEKEMHKKLQTTLRLRTLAAAKYCGLSKSTFDKYRLTGEGAIFIKIGRSVVYDTADLDRWLDDRRKKSTSDYSLKSNGEKSNA